MSSKPNKNDWFYRRSAFPLRDAMPFALEAFWENQHLYPRAAGIHWHEAGPTNFSGRVTCLAMDPRNRDTIYAGSAAGGLWRSANAGETWHPVWPKYLNQNIGAIAFDPFAPGHIFCATGEGNLSSDAYPGSGVFCSHDYGLTWVPYFEGQPESRVPRRVACIAISTAAGVSGLPYLMALGAVSKDESLPAGLYLNFNLNAKVKTREAFVTRWGIRSYDCHSVVLHPSDPRVIYAAIQPRGTLNGVWRSVDFGQTWEQLHRPGGLPAPERCGRIVLAIAPSDPNILYALVANSHAECAGVYRTLDSGETWTRTAMGSLTGESDLHHNATIAVHPDDPSYVICGATKLHRTRDGGAIWKRISSAAVPTGHHAVLISGAAAAPVIYSGNDGGVSRSINGGKTWTRRSTGMVTTMFYDVDVAPSDSRVYGGGAQQIGALIQAGNSPDDFFRAFTGDGGFIAFDAENANQIYGSSTDGRIFQHNSAALCHQGWRAFRPPLSTAEIKLRSQLLLAVRPAHGERAQQRWLATNRLWLSSGRERSFRPVSPNLDSSAISALAFSPVDPNAILAGTSNGGLFRFRFDDEEGVWTWSPNLSTSIIPDRLITQIKFHPADPNTVILSVGSTNAPAANLNGDPSPYSHVFLSSNQGNTWTDIDNGALPNVVYNALAYEARPPHRIFAGGDAGVWALDEGGWVNVTGDLPNVIVSDLVYHAADSILTAATFGRGIWRLPVPAGVALKRPSIRAVPAETVLPPFSGTLLDPSVPAPRPKVAGAGELTWPPVAGAEAYVVQISDEPENGTPARMVTCSEPRIELPKDPGHKYRCHVWALLSGSRRTTSSAPRVVRISPGARIPDLP